MKYFNTILIILLINIGINCDVNAATLSDIKKQVEEKVEKDQNIENVIVKMRNTPLLNEIDNLELIHIAYGQTSDSLLITVKLEEIEHTFNATWEKALLLPALIENSKKGKVISESDIIDVKYPENKQSINFILNKKRLIGYALKRDTPKNKPLHISDLVTPLLIEKGNRVTMQYHKNDLVIETIGVALEAGGEGEIIKLKNIDSNKLVHGKILSAGLVEVGGK